MIHVKWTAFDDATCDQFNIYRSIPGFTITFPQTSIAGTELRLQVTSPDTQIIPITSNVAADVVNDINSVIKGAMALLSDDGNHVFVRATATKNIRVKLLSCTFATAAGITPRIILPESEWEQIASVARIPNEVSYDYEDPDGQFSDSYRVTSVIAMVESLPSLIKRPSLPSPAVCAIEGRALSIHGTPLANSLVRAKPYIMADFEDSAFLPPQNQFLTTRTDVYGRFSINLLQTHVYLLEIPSVGYNDIIEVPASDWGRVVTLTATSKHWFNPGSGDPI